mmetsp:Transcript_12755/g.51267  ORF Transcript_12755/g.51267 Transcript_12755/m.51267 type:complete len:200 (+) Transcript_12755:2677-3276(+)
MSGRRPGRVQSRRWISSPPRASAANFSARAGPSAPANGPRTVRSRSRPSAGTRSPWSTRRLGPGPGCGRRTRGGRRTRTRRWAPRRLSLRRGRGWGRAGGGEIPTRGGRRPTRWTTAITGKEPGARTTSFRGRTPAWVRRPRNRSRTPRTFEGPSPGSITIRVEFLLKVRSDTVCVTKLYPYLRIQVHIQAIQARLNWI